MDLFLDAITMNHALRFKSFSRPMVWGGRKLATHLNKPLSDSNAYGESWELSDHPNHLSIVSEGPLSGKTLRDLMLEHKQHILGQAASKHSKFPWLIKYLDAHDWLSVQVHPDEEKVGTLWPGEGSKNEAWFILDAAPEGKIFAGLLPGVTEKEVREASLDGTISKLLHQFTPKAGDCLYLPAGTVHAVGGGVLIAEIQQTSDATFRLFDWNRKDSNGKGRDLHLEESIACIDWKSGPKDPIYSGYSPAKTAAASIRKELIHCHYFQIEFYSEPNSSLLGNTGCMQIAMVLNGTGTLGTGSAKTMLNKGDTLLFPASMKEQVWETQGGQSLLIATLTNT